MNDESHFLAWLAQRLPPGQAVSVGIGDDAAVLPFARPNQLVVTSDLIAEGVHFEAATEPRQIGHKALAVNLSDLAAMAARPLAASVSLLLGSGQQLVHGQAIMEGIIALASRYNMAIIGGDTNSWEFGTVVSVTAYGLMDDRQPWLRSGAALGDLLLVTGSLGGSIAGKHLEFEPRVAEALTLNERYRIHAAIDITDGLSLDLFRLVTASGCGAELDLAKIPISPAAEELSEIDGTSALQHALANGEDFELLISAPADEAERILHEQPCDCGITAIGRITADAGLWQCTEDGRRIHLAPQGFLHRFGLG